MAPTPRWCGHRRVRRKPLVRSRAAERGRDQPVPRGDGDAARFDRPAHRHTGRLGSGPALGPAVIRRRAWLLWIAAPAWAQQPEAEVDANTASRAQLESLPGLGPALVQRLLAARPFADWADLMKRVPGIRAATARKLSAAGLRVGTQPYGD